MLPIKICNNANEAAAAETTTTDADAIKAKEWHELTQPASLSLSSGPQFHQEGLFIRSRVDNAMARYEKNPQRMREFHFPTGQDRYQHLIFSDTQSNDL